LLLVNFSSIFHYVNYEYASNASGAECGNADTAGSTRQRTINQGKMELVTRLRRETDLAKTGQKGPICGSRQGQRPKAQWSNANIKSCSRYQ